MCVAGADLNVLNRLGETPLAAASKNAHLECMRALLEHGREVDKLDRQKSTHSALGWVCEGGDVEAVDLLLLHGADLDKRDGDGQTALQRCVAGQAAGKHDKLDAIEEMLRKAS